MFRIIKQSFQTAFIVQSSHNTSLVSTCFLHPPLLHITSISLSYVFSSFFFLFFFDGFLTVDGSRFRFFSFYYRIRTNDTFLKNKTTIYGMPKILHVSGIDTEVHITCFHTQYTHIPTILPEVLHTHKNSSKIVE